MEYFQSSFLNKDTVFALLRYDMAEYLKAVKQNNNYGNNQRQNLREDLDKMEREFYKLRNEFNDYVAHLKYMEV